MVSTRETEHLLSNLFIKQFDFDPGGTSLTDIGFEDGRDFGSFLFTFFRTIGTSADVMRVIANDASDGSGTDVVVKNKTIAAEPNAVGDQIHLEVSADEIRAAGEAAGEAVRHVSLQVSFATGTDEGVVTYTFGRARHPRQALTADIVA